MLLHRPACGFAQCAAPSTPSSSERIQFRQFCGAVLRQPVQYKIDGTISTGGRTLKSPSVIKAVGGGAGNQSTFLSYEEAGLIEMSKLDMHERFLCRLTVSSLNLLRIISEQEGVPIEQLNAGLICDWFQKDKVKREQDINSATLKWEPGPEW
ncbi:hypothetical protein R1sor_004478 [Riccia sorocarpa]|uniref:Uncharacterized protein n=1 Tax=Riccia sorocarpa TaxID=122646 RepID=A0ABD3HH19_9MARC